MFSLQVEISLKKEKKNKKVTSITLCLPYITSHTPCCKICLVCNLILIFLPSRQVWSWRSTVWPAPSAWSASNTQWLSLVATPSARYAYPNTGIRWSKVDLRTHHSTARFAKRLSPRDPPWTETCPCPFWAKWQATTWQRELLVRRVGQTELKMALRSSVLTIKSLLSFTAGTTVHVCALCALWKNAKIMTRCWWKKKGITER